MQRSDLARWASLPMRLLVGYGFIEHGFAKLSRGPDAFAGILQQLGVPLPHIATWADNRHGACRGLGFVAWSFCGLGEHPHGFGFASRDGHCPSAVRIQFSEAPERFRFGRAVRSCGV